VEIVDVKVLRRTLIHSKFLNKVKQSCLVILVWSVMPNPKLLTLTGKMSLWNFQAPLQKNNNLLHVSQ
jgi:hypothetical protein